MPLWEILRGISIHLIPFLYLCTDKFFGGIKNKKQ